MSPSSRKQAADAPSWLPAGPKQILLAVVLVLAVGAAAFYVWRYQAAQPKPLPKSVYENMYKSMYGKQAAPPGAPRSATPGPGGR